MYRFLQLAVAVLFFVGLLTPCTHAVEADSAMHLRFAGIPPVARFVPDIDLLPTNYCVARDGKGIVFLCNAEGVLEFDGERWKLHTLPNREIVRFIAIDKDDTLFVGGYSIFGILHREPTGLRRYEDLTTHFSSELKGRAFDDVWDVEITPEGIYFRALRDLFFLKLEDGKVVDKRYWYHEGRFGFITHHAGKTYAHFRGDAIRFREGDKWIAVSGSEQIRTALFRSVTLKNGGLLLFGYAPGWWQIQNDAVVPHPGIRGLQSTASVGAASQLSNGHTVLTMSEGSVQIYDDLEQPALASFQIDSGFITGATSDQHGGFLVASHSGAYHISWPTRWSTLNLLDKRGGTIHNIRSWGKQVFVIAQSTVSKISTESGPILLTPWIARDSHDLMPLDDRYALLASSAHHLWLLDSQKVQQPTDTSMLTQIGDDKVYPRVFERSKFVSNRVLLGTEWGLRIIDTTRSPSAITLTEAQPQRIPVRVTTFVERSAEEVWVGSERHGIWRISIEDGKPFKAHRFGDAEGLRYGVIPSANLFGDQGNVYATTSVGLFRWNAAQQRFDADSIEGLEALIASTVEHDRRRAVVIARSPNGDRWAYDETRLWHQPKGEKWRTRDVSALRNGTFQTHQFDSQGRLFLVAASGLLAYNPSLDERSGSGAQQKLTSPLIQLRAVTQVYASGKRTGWPLNPTSPVVVPKGEFSLRFEFALPDYSLERGRRYKGQLIGHDTIAGDWSLSRQYTYGGLSAGDYRLELAGKDVQGNVTAIAPYEFTVTPPWWATIWARLFAATAALTGLGFLIRWGVHRRTALLAKQNEALEAKVAARTSELTNANQQLDRMAHVDGLTGIANRRALDGAMSTAWTRAQSQNEPISVFVIDVDLFKRYNDTYGHLAGDELLKRIAGALKPCLHRPQDLIARYGGEEFVVLMPGASLIVAMRAAEEMREAVAQSDMGVTISIGVATYTPDPTRGETPSDVIKRADDALYAAKHRGRNQVVSGD